MKILMVLTSADARAHSGMKTGFDLEAFAVPYYVFREAGALVTVTSPRGGGSPLDPRSVSDSTAPDAIRLYDADPKAQAAFEGARPLASVAAVDFDALFYPGGHGCLWDLAGDASSIALIGEALGLNKPTTFIGHASGALRYVTTAVGAPVARDRSVTGISNAEEVAAGLTGVGPFRVEDMLTSQGARFTTSDDGQGHVVTDGLLITGQNQASSAAAARALIHRLGFFSAKGFLATIPWNALG